MIGGSYLSIIWVANRPPQKHKIFWWLNWVGHQTSIVFENSISLSSAIIQVLSSHPYLAMSVQVDHSFWASRRAPRLRCFGLSEVPWGNTWGKLETIKMLHLTPIFQIIGLTLATGSDNYDWRSESPGEGSEEVREEAHQMSCHLLLWPEEGIWQTETRPSQVLLACRADFFQKSRRK